MPYDIDYLNSRTNNIILINLLYFNPCISTLLENPSAILSASIPVALLRQFRKQLCFLASNCNVLDLSHIQQQRFLIPTNKILFERNPIIVAFKNQYFVSDYEVKNIISLKKYKSNWMIN